MIGLEEYIEKHGNHFTKQLAINTIHNYWNAFKILNDIESMVYYNLSKATNGDIIFLVNYHKQIKPITSKRNCIKQTLEIIGNMNNEGYAFNLWKNQNKDFNLMLYI